MTFSQLVELLSFFFEHVAKVIDGLSEAHDLFSLSFLPHQAKFRDALVKCVASIGSRRHVFSLLPQVGADRSKIGQGQARLGLARFLTWLHVGAGHELLGERLKVIRRRQESCLRLLNLWRGQRHRARSLVLFPLLQNVERVDHPLIILALDVVEEPSEDGSPRDVEALLDVTHLRDERLPSVDHLLHLSFVLLSVLP